MELERIYNEDCIVGMQEMEDRSVDLIVTDPPYLFDNGNWLKSGVAGKRSILGNGGIYDDDGKIYKEMSEFSEEDITRFLDLAVTKLKVPNMYIFCSETQVPIYGSWAREHGLHFNILTWEKPLSIINKNRFSTNTEYVIRIYDFGTALNKLNNNEMYNKVIHTQVVRDKKHPTEKPIDIMMRFVLLSSKEGDVVLDPFIGSGATAIACIRAKRKFIGFEKDKKYYDISDKRVRIERRQLNFNFDGM